ncbi:MAG: DUF2061 domain-containing protein [Patescibacteria group bacterium]|nr:DUF2061 domain-containing protein [Patescibacteria group bacterium]
MSDKSYRSIMKATSWRIIASLTTVSLVYFFTGKLTLSLEIGGLEIIFKILFYYFHERIWNKSKWGTKNNNK